MTMRGQRVVLWVPIESGWRAGDVLQVFTDWGTGTIDETEPLLTRPVRIFPEDIRTTVAHPGFGEEEFASSPFGGTLATPRAEDWGFGRDVFAGVAFGDATPFVRVPVQIPADYGTWKFAAQVTDGAGNEQGELQEFSQFISSENPPPLAAFGYSGYNEETDKVTFTYTA
jgi:hypothetical protein